MLSAAIADAIERANSGGQILIPARPHFSYIFVESDEHSGVMRATLYFKELPPLPREEMGFENDPQKAAAAAAVGMKETPLFKSSSAVAALEEVEEEYVDTGILCWACVTKPSDPEEVYLDSDGVKLKPMQVAIEKEKLLAWTNFVGSSVVAAEDYTDWSYVSKVHYR